MSSKINPFKIKDCDLVAIATGQRAQNLKELRNNLLTCHQGCVYYHFWGGLIRPRFVDPEFNNDFASWASHGIHDKKLAERLGIIDPTEFKDIEDLRSELIDVIEERLDESEHLMWSQSDSQFNFIRSEIVVFNTKCLVNTPKELMKVIPNLSVTSIFYHFIDARRRSSTGEDDFRSWLKSLDDEYTELYNMISDLDPYFITMRELKNQLLQILVKFFKDEK
jgi:hypothetical protein